MSTMPAKDFGQNLNDARIRAGMTYRDLAKVAETSISYLHGVVSGKTVPKIDTAERLAHAVNSSLDRLLRQNGKNIR